MLINSGFGAAFHTLSVCFFCPWWAHVELFQHGGVVVNHLLGVREVNQHVDKDSNTHNRAASPALTLPPFYFFSRCQLQLGMLPDSAACLSTPALPLCSLARSVSVLLGQMTHTIKACFIKEVQWLDLTLRLCEEDYSLLSGQWGCIDQHAGGPGKNQESEEEKREETYQKVQKLITETTSLINWYTMCVCVCLVWKDICKSLWCHRTGHRCETKFMPAAEGTSCGLDMVRKRFLVPVNNHSRQSLTLLPDNYTHWCTN